MLRPVHQGVREGFVWTLERRAGITTTGSITPEELGFSGENRVHYQASPWFALRRILRRADVGPGDVLVEFGSGMGRVLYQAAQRYPLRRIEGVEISPELTAIALGNIERNRPKLRCQEIRLVTSDVLDYEIPDDVTLAYFFNPFKGPIFADVIDRLVASVARNPRRLRLIYVNPVEEHAVFAAGFRVVRRSPGLRPGQQWARTSTVVLYELDPGAVGRPTADPIPRADQVATRRLDTEEERR